MKLVQSFKQFLHDEEGAVAIEYALLAALIAVAIAVAAGTLGGTISSFFGEISTYLAGIHCCSAP
jgi:pilus assembly protein Flp/PilA